MKAIRNTGKICSIVQRLGSKNIFTNF